MFPPKGLAGILRQVGPSLCRTRAPGSGISFPRACACECLGSAFRLPAAHPPVDDPTAPDHAGQER